MNAYCTHDLYIFLDKLDTRVITGCSNNFNNSADYSVSPKLTGVVRNLLPAGSDFNVTVTDVQ